MMCATQVPLLAHQPDNLSIAHCMAQSLAEAQVRAALTACVLFFLFSVTSVLRSDACFTISFLPCIIECRHKLTHLCVTHSQHTHLLQLPQQAKPAALVLLAFSALSLMAQQGGGADEHARKKLALEAR